MCTGMTLNLNKVKMEAFFEKYLTKLSENAVLGQNGECHIWTGACTSNGKYGVLNCKFPNAIGWTKIHAHRLAYMIKSKKFNYQGFDVSHLCHNSKCINTEHLSLEPHGFNNSRMTCVSVGKCLGHPCPLHPCRIELKMANNNLSK
jgi:hypothetical protein